MVDHDSGRAAAQRAVAEARASCSITRRRTRCSSGSPTRSTSARTIQTICPPYTTFDAGVTAQLTRGTLTFAATNLTEPRLAYSRARRTRYRSQPPADTYIPNIARPLQPRTYSVNLFGALRARRTHRRRPQLPSRSRRRPRSSAAADPVAGRSRRTGRPRRSGRRRRAASLALLAAAADAAGRSVCRRRQSGDVQRENAAKARQLAAELKAYVAQIEAARTAAGYPATMAAPALTDATVTYHGLGTTYALAITPKGTGVLRALAGCLSLHIARSDDVTQRKLLHRRAVRSSSCRSSTSCRPSASTSSRVNRSRGRRSFRVYKLPATPTSDPFAVRTSTDVHRAGAESRDAGAHRAARITSRAARRRRVGRLPRIRRRQAPGTSSIPAMRRSFRRCSSAAASPRRRRKNLAQRGFDGKIVSRAELRAELGLYLVRPAPRATLAPYSPYQRTRGSVRGCARVRPSRACADARRESLSPTLRSAAPVRRCERESTRRSCRPSARNAA